MKNRKNLRIGIPRVLNMYSLCAAVQRVLRKPGDSGENIVYSDYTSGELYRAGSSRGAIDPCFPAKIGIAHVHNLITIKGAQEAAQRDLLPDVGRADFAAVQLSWHRTRVRR